MASIVLREKYADTGLSKNDVKELLEKLESDDFLPLTMSAKEHESIAYGFIDTFIYDCCIEEDWEALSSFVALILDDMNLENENHMYLLSTANIKVEIYLDR